MSVVPRKCCRSLPRCASCPVLLARRQSAAQAGGSVPEALFALLAAPQRRPLPPAVAEQLELLDAARARPARVL